MDDDSQFFVRREDGFINATLLCKKGGKRCNDFMTTHVFKRFLQELEKDTGLSMDNLLHVTVGGLNRGTWVHPRVATWIAQWISAEFSVKVTFWVEQGKELIPNMKEDYLQSLEDIKGDHNDQIERDVRIRLATKVCGDQCVIGIYGEIDIVSKDEVIEVKHISKFAHALGQVQCHVESYPNKLPRVHFFGSTEDFANKGKLNLVFKLFEKHNIIMTTEII